MNWEPRAPEAFADSSDPGRGGGVVVKNSVSLPPRACPRSTSECTILPYRRIHRLAVVVAGINSGMREGVLKC